MNDERTENQEEQDETSETNQDETSETSNGQDNRNTTAGETSENKDESSTETDDPDKTEESDDGLSDAERQREQEILAEQKRISDEKAAEGRRRKKIEQDTEEFKQRQRQREEEKEEVDLTPPATPYKNDDGSINHEALAEWNMWGIGVMKKNYEELEAKTKEIDDTIENIRTRDQINNESQNYQDRFGVDKQTVDEYIGIKEAQGEIAATEYLLIQSKKAEALKAAQEQRDKEHTINVPIGNNAAYVPVNKAGDTIDTVVAELRKIPRGAELITKLQEVRETYSPEVASVIIAKVAA